MILGPFWEAAVFHYQVSCDLMTHQLVMLTYRQLIMKSLCKIGLTITKLLFTDGVGWVFSQTLVRVAHDWLLDSSMLTSSMSRSSLSTSTTSTLTISAATGSRPNSSFNSSLHKRVNFNRITRLESPVQADQVLYRRHRFRLPFVQFWRFQFWSFLQMLVLSICPLGSNFCDNRFLSHNANKWRNVYL